MVSSWFFFWLSVCTSFFLSCTASPIGLPDSGRSVALDSHDNPTSYLSIRQDSNPSAPTARHTIQCPDLWRDHPFRHRRWNENNSVKEPTNHIPKRALETPPTISYDLTTRQVIAHGLIIPSHIAAYHMKEFFNTIYGMIELGCLGGPNEPDSAHRVISMWDFELTFYSSNTVIPWNFVQDYVIEKIGDLEKGFTACYTEHMTGWVGIVANAVVTVQFRFKRPEPPLILTR